MNYGCKLIKHPRLLILLPPHHFPSQIRQNKTDEIQNLERIFQLDPELEEIFFLRKSRLLDNFQCCFRFLEFTHVT